MDATLTRTQYCTFFIDGYYFGIDVLNVQEVIRYQQMTPVPLASTEITGLINLRGQIVTAIDLRRRLELKDRAEGELPMNVVVRTDTGPVSLLVDEIDDVVEPDEESFEAPPESLNGVVGGLITGVYKTEDRLLMVLDTSRTVQLK